MAQPTMMGRKNQSNAGERQAIRYGVCQRKAAKERILAGVEIGRVDIDIRDSRVLE